MKLWFVQLCVLPQHECPFYTFDE